MKTLINFLKDESGASAAEYGILVALIAAVSVAAVKTFGGRVNTTFTGISTKF